MNLPVPRRIHPMIRKHMKRVSDWLRKVGYRAYHFEKRVNRYS
jgi:hypothetical protein